MSAGSDPQSAQVPVIAVASGKGGVGKTTAAVNIALALSQAGTRVGLVDADLYGPDAAHMMGLHRTQDASSVTVFAARGTASARLQAVRQHGVQMASAAFLIGRAQGLGVQAPIAQLLIHRLINDTAWDDLDCLIVDLPPGTADIQQMVFALGNRATYALLVVTPQVVAHRDAHRLLHELGRSKTVMLGGIENMAGQVCPSCGEVTQLFTPAPHDESIWSRTMKLVSVPFSSLAAQDADLGKPVMITRAVAEQVAAYELLARHVQEAIGGGSAERIVS
jgi:ATP-binding protein involved in chromosome partitioning